RRWVGADRVTPGLPEKRFSLRQAIVGEILSRGVASSVTLLPEDRHAHIAAHEQPHTIRGEPVYGLGEIGVAESLAGGKQLSARREDLLDARSGGQDRRRGRGEISLESSQRENLTSGARRPPRPGPP